MIGQKRKSEEPQEDEEGGGGEKRRRQELKAQQKCYVCQCKRRRGWKCPSCKQREVHFSCIGAWVEKSPTCPLCRWSLPSKEVDKITVKVPKK